LVLMKIDKQSTQNIVNIGSVMAGTSTALVGIIFLIAYEFFRAGDTTGFGSWIGTAHLATASAIFFAASTVSGLIHQSLQNVGKIKKISKWIAYCTFILGWALMFIVLGKIYLETRL